MDERAFVNQNENIKMKDDNVKYKISSQRKISNAFIFFNILFLYNFKNIFILFHSIKRIVASHILKFSYAIFYFDPPAMFRVAIRAGIFILILCVDS